MKHTFTFTVDTDLSREDAKAVIEETLGDAASAMRDDWELDAYREAIESLRWFE